MNLILLFDDDFIDPQRVILRDRRFQHIKQIHRAEPGDTLGVGQLNGLIGQGEIIRLTDEAVELQVTLDKQPPTVLPINLILALPRPQMLKRTLQTIATMGVKTLHLIHSNRVEKSFWQTPQLQEDKVLEELLLGLEQAKDTTLPHIEYHKRFRPFVEDIAPQLAKNSKALVAHPGPYPECPQKQQQAITLAVGPEGGFVDYEIEKFTAAGFEPISLGERILRVETAIPVLLAKLF